MVKSVWLLLCLLWLSFPVTVCFGQDAFPEPVNTQAAGEHPPSPEEMLELFELPEGFNVTLFAGEPDVQQPIAFDFDDQGRIWVAENYTYSARGKIDPNLRDRVVILHDKDGDGQHDERKVFWDKGSMLTSLTWGYGGLWILNDGALSFIADKDGDDVPDAEPVEMLNGWTKNAGHNFVNGLLWGPDGWLYGRHGITDTSYPGTPDTPKAERNPMNCGIWRFHPIKNTFEIVCHGTTNPWGMDYNEYGDMFMTNNVIGHLWHVIPGAHYERMFGQDFNPHCYELMGQCADHYHWDNTGKWSQSRDGKAKDLGGGHSHSGGMIYYGQNFPEEYRGKIFMCNTHGRCVNVNRLERKGSTYVGKREPDFLKVNTPWFRGVELKYGPDGCVYLTDWSDNGECHDHDGVHRTSGRIYRISYGEVQEPRFNLSTATIHEHRSNGSSNAFRSEWHRRRSSRLFMEQFHEASEETKAIVRRHGHGYWSHRPEVQTQIIWRFQNLSAVDGLSHEYLSRALICPDEKIRSLAVKHITDNPKTLAALHGIMDAWIYHHETSPVVLLAYASAIQRHAGDVPREDQGSVRFPSQSALLKLTKAQPDDRVLQLMAWYALEKVNGQSQYYAPVVWVEDPKIRSFLVRRLSSDWARNGGLVVDNLTTLLEAIYGAPSAVVRSEDPRDAALSILRGISAGLPGQVNLKMPWRWKSTREALARIEDPEIDVVLAELSAAFGDADAVQDLLKLSQNRAYAPMARTLAIRNIARLKAPNAVPVLLPLLTDRAVYVDVAKALAAFDDPRIPKELIKRWGSLRHGSRQAAMDTLVSRKSYAVELAKAIDKGRVNGGSLTASHVRQLIAFNDSTITKTIESKWGIINESSAAKETAIANWKGKLTPEVLAKANLANGAALFKKSCAACHKLYGDGGKIGPDLTGGNRGNLDYLLGNVIDPSAEVPKQFTTSAVQLTSGRVITGVVVAETAQTLTVQTDKDTLQIAISEVEDRVRTNKSLMPDGLLDSLTEQQVTDLIAFIMKRR